MRTGAGHFNLQCALTSRTEDIDVFNIKYCLGPSVFAHRQKKQKKFLYFQRSLAQQLSPAEGSLLLHGSRHRVHVPGGGLACPCRGGGLLSPGLCVHYDRHLRVRPGRLSSSRLPCHGQLYLPLQLLFTVNGHSCMRHRVTEWSAVLP
ncbi:hypothetical protein AMECASPLE_031096 [Ameca splendens]|uniref:Uncharacterized protein n=1 Tax=Ameca splendens TaxID=208324 RepID=A0ABV1A1M0_9TELE